VLSSQRVELSEALFDAAKGKYKAKEAAANPLVRDGKKLVPSVTRVFSAGRSMHVYLQAYKPSQPASQPENAASNQPGTGSPILAFVSLCRDGAKVRATPPIAVIPSGASRLVLVPLSFSFGLDHLSSGEYDCQVTILDPATQRSAFWRAPIRIVP
jgi:hypothetical protein